MKKYNINRRKFLELFGCSCCGFLTSSCGTVPITERKQLALYPESVINRQAAAAYQKLKNSKKIKLINEGKDLNNIIDIGEKIAESVSVFFKRKNTPDPTLNFEWDYILIDDKKIKNAWCMPGGKIAVYSGMLEVTKNENGLAAVMGHEIAHAVARHSLERASQSVAINVGATILDIALEGALSRSSADDYLVSLGLTLPFNRLQESEADYLGLAFMTMADYDNSESYKIWERMKNAQKNNPPEFMSTHPSPKNRIQKLKNWIPEVNARFG